MIRRPVVVSPVKEILLMRRIPGQRLADLATRASHDIDNARRYDIADQSHQGKQAERCIRSRLNHGAVSSGDCRRYLPGSHQQWKIPRSDLPNHAHWFLEMVGDGILVQLACGTLFCADAACEVAEVVRLKLNQFRHVAEKSLALIGTASSKKSGEGLTMIRGGFDKET
jgi:hypothetical protein